MKKLLTLVAFLMIAPAYAGSQRINGQLIEIPDQLLILNDSNEPVKFVHSGKELVYQPNSVASIDVRKAGASNMLHVKNMKGDLVGILSWRPYDTTQPILEVKSAPASYTVREIASQTPSTTFTKQTKAAFGNIRPLPFPLSVAKPAAPAVVQPEPVKSDDNDGGYLVYE